MYDTNLNNYIGCYLLVPHLNQILQENSKT